MEKTSLTLDANWRWVHDAQMSNCYKDSDWNKVMCPDPVTCSANCYLEGVSSDQYKDTYGISQIEAGVKLTFVSKTTYGVNYGSRLYMMEDQASYKLFHLKNREFTFTVDLREMPCGLNGALYFVQMDADGGIKSSGGKNEAGAKYGTGYCDAQCPKDIKFILGEANTDKWNDTSPTPIGRFGSCCSEMDVWEANSRAAAFTAHPCKTSKLYRCAGDDCSTCDKAGCDFNPYRMGNTTFFGRGDRFGLNTKKPMTVVTQFITDDSTDAGSLVEIRRFYMQDGVVFPNSNSSILGVSGNSISDAFCDDMKACFGDVNDFALKGGLKSVGQALERGMVLVFSLWDDSFKDMLWLDSAYPADAEISVPGVARGPCRTDSGSPSLVREMYPTASVTFSSVKVGLIGTTFGAGGGSGAHDDPFGGGRRLNALVP